MIVHSNTQTPKKVTFQPHHGKSQVIRKLNRNMKVYLRLFEQ